MAQGNEVAVGYISIIPDTSRIAPGVKNAVAGISVDGQTKTLGSKIASGIGKTLKVGVASVGAAAGGVLATSLTKGFGRLTAIDDAKAKLTGLGNSADDVAKIMENANAAVKGTAFGLDEAATTAAAAVAANIAPGRELERTLRIVGDTAAIAGTSMADMGAIFNSVAARGKLQGDDLLQLVSRGVPVLQFLAEETGKTSAEISDMVSKGQIDFELFQAAMERGLGGSALAMGNTFKGAFANMNAAMGRFGAKLLEPVFKAAPPVFTALTGAFDSITKAITPAIDALSAKMTPAVEDFMGRLPQMWESLQSNPEVRAQWEKLGELFGHLRDVAFEVVPPLLSIGSTIGEAAGKISLATWTALIDTLNLMAPVIKQVAEILAAHPGLVTAFVTAWLGARAVGQVTAPLRGVAGALLKVAQVFAIAKFGSEMAKLAVATKTTSPALSSFATMASRVSKAMNPFGTVLKFVVSPLRTVAGLITKMVPKLLAFLGPWGWIAAAVGALVGALTWFFTKTETGQRIWGAFMDQLRVAGEWLKNVFAAAWDKVMQAMEPVFEWMRTAFEGIKNLIVGGDFTSAIRDAFGIEEDHPAIQGILTIRDAFVGLRDLIVGGDFTGALTNAFGWEEDSPAVAGILKIRDVLVGIPDLARSIRDVLFSGDTSTLPFGLDENSPIVSVMLAIRDAVTKAWEAFQNLRPTLAEIGQTVGGAILGVLKSLGGALQTAGEAIWGVIKAVAPVLLPVLKVLGAIVGGALMVAIGAFVVALKVIGKVIEWVAQAISIAVGVISAIFKALVVVGQWLVAIITTAVIAPMLIAWNLLSAAFQWAWESIIKPIWDGFGAVMQWVWTTLIMPVWEAMKAGFNVLGTFFGWVWTSLIKPAWDAFGLGIQWVWQSIISPAWDALKLALQAVGMFFGWVWTSLIKPAWDALGAGIRVVWESVIRPAWDALKAALQVVGQFFQNVWTGVIKPVWEALGAGISAVIDNVVKPAFEALKTALDHVGKFFDSVVEGIKTVWNSLKQALAKPINFMINTVYNQGIVKAWNAVAEKLPGVNALGTLSGIPEYAAGGRISGPGTGTSDDVLMWGSNGEHMITAAEVRAAGGHGAIYMLREMIARGIPFTWDGGQFLRDLGPKNIAEATRRMHFNGDSSLEGMPIPGFAEGGRIRPAWEIAVERGHRFAQSIAPGPYLLGGNSRNGSTDCSGYMSEIADVILGGPGGTRQWATGNFPGTQGGAWAPGLSQGFSVGIVHGGPAGGHTAGTLSAAGPFGATNVESGGGTGQGATYGPPAAGADSPSLPNKHHLKIGADGAFEAGGGPSREEMISALRTWVKGLFDKILDPIKGAIASVVGTPPPEWYAVPPDYLTWGKDKSIDFFFDQVENLTSGLRTVWDLIKGNITMEESGLLRDTGGWIPRGLSLVRNETGKPEAVLTWEQVEVTRQVLAEANKLFGTPTTEQDTDGAASSAAGEEDKGPIRPDLMGTQIAGSAASETIDEIAAMFGLRGGFFKAPTLVDEFGRKSIQGSTPGAAGSTATTPVADPATTTEANTTDPATADEPTANPEPGQAAAATEPVEAPPADAAAPGTVQEKVQARFATRGWNTGEQWAATDNIVTKESNWNPTAVNPSSGAFGLFQFLGATQQQYLPDKNPDPSVQGDAGRNYISDRYGTPVKAWEFWQANGWYDKGGVAKGVGMMAKDTIKPERVLSPQMTLAFDELIGMLPALISRDSVVSLAQAGGGAVGAGAATAGTAALAAGASAIVPVVGPMISAIAPTVASAAGNAASTVAGVVAGQAHDMASDFIGGWTSGGDSGGGGGGDNITININGGNDPQAIAAEVQRVLRNPRRASAGRTV
ncbi:aggregation-promoting factor C-terminal-like domain-containing protein [Corynebacterium freneyi]|uniref:aggregation-promoting factor C-terminal-like domain-containing protein n=1 Tax=Corynebacterium freneyi TaxID=134034 RepID=UPI001CCB5B4C|nr:tape measure protein [Corynebacterium freneyi]UBI01557.1 tape measure protein [Corynebacterium freneyi]